MPNVLIRDVPDDVHARLTKRAAERGQSLQQYLVSELDHLVERPTVDELMDRIESRKGGGQVGMQAVQDIADERARR